MALDKGMCTPLIPVFFSKLSWKNMFVMFVIPDDLYSQGLQSSSLTPRKPGMKKMVLFQQGPLPWLYWRTWSQATFTWWRFLHPTTWAMVRSQMWWSCRCEQISPQAMILGSLEAPHTPQVNWYFRKGLPASEFKCIIMRLSVSDVNRL